MTAWGAFEKEVLPLVAKMARYRKKRILTEEQPPDSLRRGGRDAPKNGEIKGHKPEIRPQIR